MCQKNVFLQELGTWIFLLSRKLKTIKPLTLGACSREGGVRVEPLMVLLLSRAWIYITFTKTLDMSLCVMDWQKSNNAYNWI